MDIEANLLALAERQHSLATRRQYAELGAGPKATRHLFEGHPRWEPLTDEVIRLRGPRRTDAQAAMAAVLDAGPGAKLSHLSGGNQWGLSSSLRPFHVVTTVYSRRRTTLSRVHQVRTLPDTWTTELDGIPIVRPELLALQIFAVCREARATDLVEHLWAMRLLSGGSLAAFLSQLGERGRNGTAGLRRYLEPRGVNYVPAATNLERRAISILEQAGYPMRRQVDSGSEHWDGRVDLRHETGWSRTASPSSRCGRTRSGTARGRSRPASVRGCGRSASAQSRRSGSWEVIHSHNGWNWNAPATSPPTWR